MIRLLISILLIGATLGALWVFGPRIIKTGTLIALTSPYERALPNAPQLLVLGDSTGYGTGVMDNNDSIAGRVAEEYPDYEIVNQSQNGRTIAELESVAREVEGEYALILLQIGGNDILQGRDAEVVEEELRRIIISLTDNTDDLVMMSTGNVGGASAFTGERAQELEERSRVFRDMFEAVASDTPLTYVDLFVEPENDPFVAEPSVYLSWDGLHPSAAGYGEWYDSLQPVLAERLGE